MLLSFIREEQDLKWAVRRREAARESLQKITSGDFSWVLNWPVNFLDSRLLK